MALYQAFKTLREGMDNIARIQQQKKDAERARLLEEAEFQAKLRAASMPTIPAGGDVVTSSAPPVATAAPAAIPLQMGNAPAYSVGSETDDLFKQPNLGSLYGEEKTQPGADRSNQADARGEGGEKKRKRKKSIGKKARKKVVGKKARSRSAKKRPGPSGGGYTAEEKRVAKENDIPLAEARRWSKRVF